jgi:cytochrome c biogenesis protein CcmG, thiol:disulfide interchange protein DsbE
VKRFLRRGSGDAGLVLWMALFLALGPALAACTGPADQGGARSGAAAAADADADADKSVGTTMLPPSALAETTDAAETARLLRAAKLPPCPATSDAVARPDGLPELTLPCLGTGPYVRLAGLRGSPLVVNVWASWCPPCAQEMPYLLGAHKALRDDVAFLGIDLVDRRSAALAWARDFGMTFPSVQDPDGLIRAELRVMAPPVTVFVRPDGAVAKIHYGAFTSERQVRDAIAEHLGVRR